MNTSPAVANIIDHSAVWVAIVPDEGPGRCAAKEHFSALMRAAQDGDRVAYAALLRGVLPLLERVVQSRLRFLQPADRDDLVQDILLSMHAGRATYDPRRPFMPWLMSIARNRMVDRARRCGRQAAKEVPVDDLSELAGTDDSRPGESEFGDPQALHRAVQALPTRQRAAIELLKLRELSLKEAAAMTGMGTSALKVSAHRAMKKLRDSLA